MASQHNVLTEPAAPQIAGGPLARRISQGRVMSGKSQFSNASGTGVPTVPKGCSLGERWGTRIAGSCVELGLKPVILAQNGGLFLIRCLFLPSYSPSNEHLGIAILPCSRSSARAL